MCSRSTAASCMSNASPCSTRIGRSASRASAPKPTCCAACTFATSGSAWAPNPISATSTSATTSSRVGSSGRTSTRDDGGRHSDDDGINLSGDGHVVCHNQISGFGDAMKFGDDGARADDFYGNEVLSSYDNAIEFDGSEGNVRAFRNRFTNTYAPISFQPVFGGPAYAIRNVVVNVADEQLKFHARTTRRPRSPNGVLVYNNTFVSPEHALNLSDRRTRSHHFTIENNLFVGPNRLRVKVVDWSAPDRRRHARLQRLVSRRHLRLRRASASGRVSRRCRRRGRSKRTAVLLSPPIFASGLVAPSSYKATMDAARRDARGGSNALDAGARAPERQRRLHRRRPPTSARSSAAARCRSSACGRPVSTRPTSRTAAAARPWRFRP